jgi:hypothetical protein
MYFPTNKCAVGEQILKLPSLLRYLEKAHCSLVLPKDELSSEKGTTFSSFLALVSTAKSQPFSSWKLNSLDVM